VSFQLDQRFQLSLIASQTEILLFFVGNWSFNFNYWTAGSLSLPGQWAWCKPGLDPQAMDAGLVWESSNSSGVVQQDCAHLRIRKDGSGVQLTEKDCKSMFIFACQVTNEVADREIEESVSFRPIYCHRVMSQRRRIAQKKYTNLES